MNRFTLTYPAAVAAVALFACLAPVHAQDIIDPAQLQVLNPSWTVARLPKGNSGGDFASSSSISSNKLAVWQYQVKASRDGNTYQGSIVGGNPFNRGARTTTVPVVVIPLRVQFTGNVRNFDPTSADTGCLGAGNTAVSLTQGSPIFQPAPFTMNGVNVGPGTFPDTFQRASFWPSVSAVAPAYHLAFNLSVAATQTVSVVNGTSNGTTYTFSGSCSSNTLAQDNPGNRLGVIDINYLDPFLKNIIANLGITANQFPLFVIYGVVISDGAATNLSNCCILGYHNANGTPANPGQTYGITEYDQSYLFSGTKDVSVMSHEVLEWINDPSVNNVVPAWGNIGQVSGCQGNLETGDPLSGTLMPPVLMPNGVTYHLQENAFFGWFVGTQFPGAGGKYSSNGTFSGVAKGCPPGGTN